MILCVYIYIYIYIIHYCCCYYQYYYDDDDDDDYYYYYYDYYYTVNRAVPSATALHRPKTTPRARGQRGAPPPISTISIISTY